ncbi:MAG: FAD-binding protein [Thermodesulfobacteriota bacterium]
MKLDESRANIIDTDVLVIGGGIAGCFAALKASEIVKNVTVIEKATLRRGGSVGPGMDHVSAGVGSPIPNTPTLEEAIKDAQSTGVGKRGLSGFSGNHFLKVAKGMYDRILDFERFGVKMREDNGSFKQIWPKERGNYGCLTVRGVDLKTKLGEAVQKTKVNVLERTMAVDLLTHDGAVTGAVALNVRNGMITVVKSKAIVVSTGVAGRVFIPQDGLFLTYDSTTNCGDGSAMAYRAGAELINVEFAYLDYVSVRDGGGIFGLMPFEWLPHLVNQRGEQLINSWEDSRNRLDIMIREIKEGRGPVYWDCRHLPEEAFEILERNIANEYPITQKWYKDWGINIRKDLIPIQIVPCSFCGGLLIDEDMKTSLKGLYAAGDQTSFTYGLSGSASSGHLAGEYAANYAREAGKQSIEEEQVQRCIGKIRAPLREKGINPIELEEMARAISTDYTGLGRTGVVREKGLEILMGLREKYIPTLHARNFHELMRCVEVQNIFDTIEMHIRASLVRKESRSIKRGGISFWQHQRNDYPKTDPEWEKWIVIHRENGEMRLSTRKLPE